MTKHRSIPVALTIAGSDSGGGAGIQADLKTFDAFGVHGVTAITCLTAQNPSRILGLQPCPPKFLALQLEAVFLGFHPAAVKTGMLHSGKLIRIVAEFLAKQPQLKLVIDPVMISTSGTRLLDARAVRTLTQKLFPLATLVTPNLDEASALLGWTVRTVEDMRRAARQIHHEHGCAVVIKGGHLRGCAESVDIFFDGTEEMLLTAPHVKGVRTHGTGCAYSAAVTACLAKGLKLPDAVVAAKEFITNAIAGGRLANGHFVLNTRRAANKSD